MLEVHSPDPAPGHAAITGYSFFTGPISNSGGIAVAGIHSDDDIAFDYRIVAKRRGYESKRLERAPDPKEMERRRGVPFKETRRPQS